MLGMRSRDVGGQEEKSTHTAKQDGFGDCTKSLICRLTSLYSPRLPMTDRLTDSRSSHVASVKSLQASGQNVTALAFWFREAGQGARSHISAQVQTLNDGISDALILNAWNTCWLPPLDRASE